MVVTVFSKAQPSIVLNLPTQLLIAVRTYHVPVAVKKGKFGISGAFQGPTEHSVESSNLTPNCYTKPLFTDVFKKMKYGINGVSEDPAEHSFEFFNLTSNFYTKLLFTGGFEKKGIMVLTVLSKAQPSIILNLPT